MPMVYLQHLLFVATWVSVYNRSKQAWVARASVDVVASDSDSESARVSDQAAPSEPLPT